MARQAAPASTMTALPERLTPSFLKRLELLRMHSRRAFLGSRQGGHISLKKGHGIEFSDYRRYSLGDNPRHIDWGVYGRSDKLYVKRFQEEQDLPFLVVLDKTFSMMRPEHDGKWEMARDIALSLTYIAFLQHDRVRIGIPGSQLSAQYQSPRALHRLAHELEQCPSPSPEEFFRGLPAVLQRFRFPGMAVFLSDFLFPLEHLEKIIKSFQAKNLDSTFIQILGAADRGLSINPDAHRLLDAESGSYLDLEFSREIRDEYHHLLDGHLQSIRQMCHSSHIRFFSFSSDEDIESIMCIELPRAGFLR